jgi:hypothetical protein
MQSWDRSKYTFPKGADCILQAQDITIVFKNGKIAIAYQADPYRCTPQSMYAKLVEQMSHYMLRSDLDMLLEDGNQSYLIV